MHLFAINLSLQFQRPSIGTDMVHLPWLISNFPTKATTITATQTTTLTTPKHWVMVFMVDNNVTTYGETVLR